MQQLVFELPAKYTSRRSFYGKAIVKQTAPNIYELYSYNTLVSRSESGTITHLGKFSATTTRHQKEFEMQFSNRQK